LQGMSLQRSSRTTGGRGTTILTVKSEEQKPEGASRSRSHLVGRVFTGVGCLASVVVAFFALSGVGFAAWMTALPPGMATMTHEEAVRQGQTGVVIFLVACLVGASLLLRLVRGALLRRRNVQTAGR
jgi:hypothetical protein